MSAIIGLDFGGCNTEIYVKGKGIVLREPSVAAVDPDGRVVAVGTEALLIRGRTPGSVTIRRPVRDSVISDFNLTAEMLDRFIELAAPRGRKRVYAALKCGIGGENRELIRNALDDCRVSRIEFIDSPLASLRGSGYDSEDGILLCDIGGGSVECSYIRDGDILRTETYFGGGRDADKTICAYLRRRYGLAATKINAQAAKHKLDLTTDNWPYEVTIAGLDTSTGMPRRLAISSDELFNCAAPQIKGAADCIKAVRSNLPRYAGKAAEVDRVILTGGGAMLSGIAEYIADECSDGDAPLEVITAEEPLDCTVRGLGLMIEETKN